MSFVSFFEQRDRLSFCKELITFIEGSLNYDFNKFDDWFATYKKCVNFQGIRKRQKVGRGLRLRFGGQLNFSNEIHMNHLNHVIDVGVESNYSIDAAAAINDFCLNL